MALRIIRNLHLYSGPAQPQGGFGAVKSPTFGQPISRTVARIAAPPAIRMGVPGIPVDTNPGAYDQQYIKKLTLDLSIVRNAAMQAISGTILWLYRVYNTADGSPNTTATIQVQIASLNADALTWAAGNGIEGIPFSAVYLTNATQAGVACELAYFRDSASQPVRFF